FCFFFFQAEDGIRDLIVTGVQTCALPICYAAQGGDWGAAVTTWMASQRPAGLAAIHLNLPVLLNPPPIGDEVTPAEQEALDQLTDRNERRVGKECKSGWAAGQEKEKRRGE